MSKADLGRLRARLVEELEHAIEHREALDSVLQHADRKILDLQVTLMEVLASESHKS